MRNLNGCCSELVHGEDDRLLLSRCWRVVRFFFIEESSIMTMMVVVSAIGIQRCSCPNLCVRRTKFQFPLEGVRKGDTIVCLILDR